MTRLVRSSQTTATGTSKGDHFGEGGFPPYGPSFVHSQIMSLAALPGQAAPPMPYSIVSPQPLNHPAAMEQPSVPPLPPDAGAIGLQAIKNKGGRPKSDFWVFFDEVGELRGKTNRKAAKCKYCNTEIHDARVETLAKHITNECKKVRICAILCCCLRSCEGTHCLDLLEVSAKYVLLGDLPRM